MHAFSRVEELVGEENLNKIKNARVLIVGLGGVGGMAAVTLARCGVENMILIDGDTVDVTNINRQVIAFTKTIGKYKTEVMTEYLQNINNNINILALNKFLDRKNIDDVFELEFDYVIDACDTIDTKKLIIDKSIECSKHLISCMGTAKKTDPHQLTITTLNRTEADPLAKILRKWARSNYKGVKIPVVSSKEKMIELEDNAKLSSLSFVPNTAGIMCAKYIIDKVIGNYVEEKEDDGDITKYFK